MLRPVLSSLLILTVAACDGGSSSDSPDGPGGKADDLTADENGTPALFYTSGATEVTDAACDGCDAVGFGRATVVMNAPLAGRAILRATIRHPNPEELAVFLEHNSNGDIFNLETEGSWSQILSGDPEDDDALVHGVRKLDDKDGCTTTAEHPDCYEITLSADLGMRDIIGSKFVDGNVSQATWDLDVIDKGFNGATGTIIDLVVTVEDPKFFM